MIFLRPFSGHTWAAQTPSALCPPLSTAPWSLGRAPCISCFSSNASCLLKEREAGCIWAMGSWREVTGLLSVMGSSKSLEAASPGGSAGCCPVTCLCRSPVLGVGGGGEGRVWTSELGSGVKRQRMPVRSARRFSSDLCWIALKLKKVVLFHLE